MDAPIHCAFNVALHGGEVLNLAHERCHAQVLRSLLVALVADFDTLGVHLNVTPDVQAKAPSQ